MAEDVVGAVLKDSRKIRKHTTCYPCQRRKVKCDRGQPCKVCIARGHSFLCIYGRQVEPSHSTSTEILHAPDDGDSLRREPSLSQESEITLLRSQLKHFHQELRRLRAHHKHCEAIQDEVHQLRARCGEYEVICASLSRGIRSDSIAKMSISKDSLEHQADQNDRQDGPMISNNHDDSETSSCISEVSNESCSLTGHLNVESAASCFQQSVVHIPHPRNAGRRTTLQTAVGACPDSLRSPSALEPDRLGRDLTIGDAGSQSQNRRMTCRQDADYFGPRNGPMMIANIYDTPKPIAGTFSPIRSTGVMYSTFSSESIMGANSAMKSLAELPGIYSDLAPVQNCMPLDLGSQSCGETLAPFRRAWQCHSSDRFFTFSSPTAAASDTPYLGQSCVDTVPSLSRPQKSHHPPMISIQDAISLEQSYAKYYSDLLIGKEHPDPSAEPT